MSLQQKLLQEVNVTGFPAVTGPCRGPNGPLHILSFTLHLLLPPFVSISSSPLLYPA